MDLTKVTCKRCKGTGLTDNAPVFAGVPGGCYKCATRGWHYKSKFAEAFADAKGEWWGVTITYRHGLFVTKSISRCEESDLSLDSQMTVARITEEQAQKFFDRYGVSTYVYPK